MRLVLPTAETNVDTPSSDGSNPIVAWEIELRATSSPVSHPCSTGSVRVSRLPLTWPWPPVLAFELLQDAYSKLPPVAMRWMHKIDKIASTATVSAFLWEKRDKCRMNDGVFISVSG